MRYDKLVRDRIPEIIISKGQTCSYHAASEEEYREKLYEKLGEETAEFVSDRNAGEIADLLEVLDAIMEFEGISRDEVEEAKRKKSEERGGFGRRLILEES